jgi:hypothetical protein
VALWAKKFGTYEAFSSPTFGLISARRNSRNPPGPESFFLGLFKAHGGKSMPRSWIYNAPHLEYFIPIVHHVKMTYGCGML